MMDDLKDQILMIFKKVMMDKVDTLDIKTLNYWNNAITKNQKTLIDFKSFLSKSQDYRNILRSTFFDVFYERMSENDYQHFYDEFLTKYENKMGDITVDDMYTFIHSTPAFEEKFSKIITDVYSAIKDTNPSLSTIQHYLHRFLDDKDFNLNNLQMEIERQNTEQEHDIDAIELENLMRVPNDLLEVYKKYKTLMKSSENVVDTNITTTHNTSQDNLYEEAIDIFERIYGRNMNVREYFLYKGLFDDVPTNEIIKTVSMLKGKHEQALGDVNEVFNRYLDKQVDENTFIRDFLPKINQSDFLDNLKYTIISSDEYESKMCHRLTVLYNKMYDDELSTEDVTYIFGNVRNKGFDLHDEEINNFIVEYKNETDTIVERIFRIFLDTYEREPDVNEISQYVHVYRSNVDKTHDEIDVYVQNELYESLEYHDVIKSRIKDKYTSLKKTNILPSMVYTILQKVLKFDDKKDIDTHIEQVICGM